MRAEIFHRISIDLTGESRLDPARSAHLLRRFLAASTPEKATAFAAVVEALPDGSPEREVAIARDIMADEARRRLAKTIIMLWFTGDLAASPDDAREPIPAIEADYFGGLLWKLVSAHPPALSGGYFGHWTYPPDN